MSELRGQACPGCFPSRVQGYPREKWVLHEADIEGSGLRVQAWRCPPNFMPL